MNPYAEALAWALVHFVWQGAALALASFLLIRSLKPPANGRYAIGIATLAAMLASPVVTFVVLAGSGNVAAAAPGATLATDAAASAASLDAAISTATAAVPAAVNATALLLGAWLIGVVVFSLRLAGGWVLARRMITQAVRPVAPDVALLARRVAARLALDRAFQVVESSAVSVPVMAGWLKPVILLPAVALSGLTTTQVEALLAHELAHVRRHDYLVNLIQAAVETLLFYHPAVWWVSRQVRAERENCCDDLAVGVCDRLVYVSALTDLAAMTVPRTALAATGGSLLSRVQRLLGRRDETSRGGGWIGVLVALFTLGALAPSLSATLASREQASRRPNPTVPAVIEEAQPERAVQSGVPGGVQGGVQGGVMTAAVQGVEPGELLAAIVFQSQQEQATAERERAERILREMQNLEEQRRDLDRRKLDQNAAAQLAAAKAQLEEARNRLERSRQLVERGVMNKDELIKAEVQLFQAEQKMVAVQRDLEIRSAELGLAQRNSADTEPLQRRLQEIERARRDLDLAAVNNPQEAARLKERLAQLQREMEELKLAIAQTETGRADRKVMEARAVVERAQQERLQELGLDLDRRLTEPYSSISDPKEPIKVGDVLIVEISGETQLPKSYTVGENGTIRLPLLGQLKVAGLTAQQAGQAISKQVARVNSSATVHVSLRRPGRESRRDQ